MATGSQPPRTTLTDVLEALGCPPGSRVLDFGCGAGGSVRVLRAHGYEAYGADIDQETVARAQATLTAEGLPANTIVPIATDRNFHLVRGAYELPFPDGHFRAIVAEQVFEHVSDLDAVLRCLHRVLAPGGVLYATFPLGTFPIEPHIRVPFAHWLPYGRLRARYIDLCYALRIGINRQQGGDYQNEYLHKGVFYRPWREYQSRFSRYFKIEDIAGIKYGLRVRRRAPALTRFPPGLALAALINRFAFRSVALHKAGA